MATTRATALRRLVLTLSASTVALWPLAAALTASSAAAQESPQPSRESSPAPPRPSEASAADFALPPAPTRWVTDVGGLLSPGAARTLDRRLEAYQRQTGHQLVVWIGKSLGGQPLEEFTVRAFEAWKLGRAEHDDGLLVAIFADDRKIGIEVGYGLEGSVPDVVASRVIREVMAPGLRAGQADQAVTSGVEALIAAIEGTAPSGLPGEAGGAGAEGEAGPEGKVDRPPTPLEIGFFLLVALGFVVLFIKNPALALYLLSFLLRGGRGGGGGGGGMSGGGGSSGGGGARGSW